MIRSTSLSLFLTPSPHPSLHPPTLSNCQKSESKEEIPLQRRGQEAKLHLFSAAEGNMEQKSEPVSSFGVKNSSNLQVTAEVIAAYSRKLFRKTGT